LAPELRADYVIERVFHPGMGEDFRAEQTTAFGEEGFTVMPLESPHDAFAEGETTIQLTTVGPWEIYDINEADDPRESFFLQWSPSTQLVVPPFVAASVF